jgi:hypothetical protein
MYNLCTGGSAFDSIVLTAITVSNTVTVNNMSPHKIVMLRLNLGIHYNSIIYENIMLRKIRCKALLIGYVQRYFT